LHVIGGQIEDLPSIRNGGDHVLGSAVLLFAVKHIISPASTRSEDGKSKGAEDERGLLHFSNPQKKEKPPYDPSFTFTYRNWRNSKRDKRAVSVSGM